MKNRILLGLVAGIVFMGSVSAMEMMDSGSMMDHPTMMTHDSMMKKPTGSVILIAKYYGYTWKTDRAKLATMAGISHYRGTMKQNLIIRAYLLQMNTMASHDMMK